MNGIKVRAAAAFAIVAFASQTLAAAAAVRPLRVVPHPDPVILTGTLADKSGVQVFSNGLALIEAPKKRTFSYRPLPYDAVSALSGAATKQEATNAVIAALSRAPQSAYVPHRLVIAFRNGVGALQDRETIPATTLVARRKTPSLAPLPYTSDAVVNGLLSRFGADRIERIGSSIPRSRLTALSTRAANGANAIDLGSIYRVHVTASGLSSAIRSLSEQRNVAVVEPDWTVTSMNTGARAVASAARWASARMHRPTMLTGRSAQSLLAGNADLPQNYGVTASLQAYLNAPGVNAIAAYDEIQQRFKQLPGAGEIITNVSLGDLDDRSAFGNPNDPCVQYVQLAGATTTLIGGQRYLDMPSMPLIPAFVADSTGTASSTAEVCGIDPSDGEIDLDFSVMAPLPHSMQRVGEIGAGLDDLMGIAPGAQYRLVVPQTTANSDLLGAFLAASQQSPAPNIITASIGFGSDNIGFPGRYLEDDILSQSLIHQIVNSGIVVCLSANDGLRMGTNAAVNPSGGSTATNLAATTQDQTSLNDLYYSTVPSQDIDTGAIDVGGTTLDDIFAANPLDPSVPRTSAGNRTWPETRWTGFGSFSSGYGSRVNISAPSDNDVVEQHYTAEYVSSYDDVSVVLEGGTSASAPMVAASAAIAMQVARLTGHPFASPTDVRSFLIKTATPVAPLAQADVSPNVGPQVNVGRAVEMLLANSGKPMTPGLGRVAIMQRRSDLVPATAFWEDTNPADIDLQRLGVGTTGVATDQGVNDPITIAPDWEAMPPGTTYRLYVTGHPTKVLATTPYARLYPAQILTAAGDQLVSPSPRNVSLTYVAVQGFHSVVQASFGLTFGPADATSLYIPQPLVPATVTGTTIPVSYDVSTYPPASLGSPKLVISYPGRLLPLYSKAAIGLTPPFKWAYSVPLSSNKGTVNIPVNALQGAGIYAVGISLNSTSKAYSDFAYTHVSSGNQRPAAPLLQAIPAPPSATAVHSLEVPYGASFDVSYDVSSVSGANGAIVEFSAAAPTLFGSDNTFNNPDGSTVDDNGIDSGSVGTVIEGGTRGTVVITAAQAKLVPTMMHSVRVIPTSGGKPVGEASDVATITMDGLVAPDGGGFQGGYQLNASGNDGLYTSNQVTAAGQVITSLGTFTQDTVVPSQLITSNAGDQFSLPGSGMLPGDLALFQDSGPPPNPAIYYTIPNVGSYTANSFVNYNQWTPPSFGSLPNPPEGLITQMASYANGTSTAFLVYAGADQDPTQQYWVFGADPVQGTAGNVYNVSAGLSSFEAPDAYGFDYDPSSNTAYVTADEGFEGVCQFDPTRFISVNLGTGAVTTTNAPGEGLALGMALDPKTHIAAFPSWCNQTPSQIDIANLAGGSPVINNVALSQGGWPGGSIAADSTNGLFLVQQPIPDTIDSDSNAMSQIDVLNESGTLLKTIAPFSFPVTLAGNHFFSVNGTTRRGFVFGSPATDGSAAFYELQPFNY